MLHKLNPYVLGVLTKPDRIPAGEEDNWLRYICNQDEPLEHGWFSVKQPDSRAIAAGITWSEAREREREFFSTTSPWNVLDLEYQNRLGTGKLVERLSDVLSECISQRYLIYRLTDVSQAYHHHLGFPISRRSCRSS